MHAHRWLATLGRAAAPFTALVAGALLVSGCGGSVTRTASWPDAPFELRDEGDRELAIDRLWLLAPGAERTQLRSTIAAATIRRLRDALVDNRDYDVARLSDELVGLWHPDPTAIGTDLGTQLPLLRDLRARFARAGLLEQTVQILAVLAEVDASGRTQHLAELDEVLGYANDLAIAEYGAAAVRSQPIKLLDPVATRLPLPWLVDRYVTLLVERQNVVSAILEQGGGSVGLVRTHQDILVTAQRLAGVLARAGRIEELHRHYTRMAPASIGLSRELTVRAEVVAAQPTPGAYADLASAMRIDEDAPDPGGALAVELAGLTKWPDAVGLVQGAADDARAVGRGDLAISLYERRLAQAGAPDPTSVLRLGKLYADRIGRLATGGRPHAAEAAWREVVEFTAAAAKLRPHPSWQQAAAIAETALGRGLASQGMIEPGRESLTASLERAPSIDAFEALTTIAVQVDELEDADRWASAALDVLGDQTTGDRYRRAKLERLDAEALRRSGRADDAGERFLTALRTWASLGDAKDLPPAIQAERLLDSGRCMWWLGDPERAANLVHAAVDLAPASPGVAAGAVVFFLQSDRVTDAVDAFHRALGEPGVPEVYKTYTSLWIVAHARRQRAPEDPQARAYLAGRTGDLWYERLAQAAVGTLPYADLAKGATTGPQQGELAFYGAVLGLAPEAKTSAGARKLLEQAVAARGVFDAEYDLARLYLAHE